MQRIPFTNSADKTLVRASIICRVESRLAPTTFQALRETYVFTKVLIFFGLLGSASMLHAQASPTASRAADLKVGGGFTSASSDYGHRFNGVAAYFDLDFTRHLGVEGEFHFIKDRSGNDLYEKTYEIGARYFRTYGRFVPYGKLMIGRGVFNFPAYVPGGLHPNLAYNMWAGGAGVDYKALPYLYVRGDFEYQDWGSFPPAGLTPALVTVGVAYHFR